MKQNDTSLFENVQDTTGQASTKMFYLWGSVHQKLGATLNHFQLQVGTREGKDTMAPEAGIVGNAAQELAP